MRNTPTGVGKTVFARSCDPMIRKHPHGRGEDEREGVPFRRPVETPPRAWGRLAVALGDIRTARNTPTGVGKTARHSTLVELPAETPPRAWGRPCLE